MPSYAVRSYGKEEDAVDVAVAAAATTAVAVETTPKSAISSDALSVTTPRVTGKAIAGSLCVVVVRRVCVYCISA